MKPTDQPIAELFSPDWQYIVPIYQRAYCWKEEEHWEPLWEDIEKHAEERLENPDTKMEHFLGAIILSHQVIHGRGHPHTEIIDGQQRLTTLQIFLCALRDYAKEINDDYVFQTISQFVKNRVPSSVDKSERLKILSARVNREEFISIIDNKTPVGKIGEAYKFFYGKIESFVEKDKTKLEALSDVVRKSLKLVKIELENEDDPQIIFETLNARGEPLLISDLIKNFLFMQVDAEADELYEKYWKSFDSKPWQEQVVAGRIPRTYIDLFIFHYLTVKASPAKPFKIESLYKEFKAWYKKEYENKGVKAFLEDFTKYRDYYEKLIQPNNNTQLDTFARRLKIIDTQTPYPCILYLMDLLEKKSISSEEMEKLIAYFESWLVRRAVDQKTKSGYNRFFVNLLGIIKLKTDGIDIIKCVSEELSSSANSQNWPLDDEFKSSWLNFPIYKKNKLTLMLLAALNEKLSTARTESILNKKDMTIEHLLPQGAKLDLYPYAENSPLKKEDENKETFRKRIIDTIGNLTSITGSLNSSISNGPIDKKIEEIKKHSILRINNELKETDSWDEESIKERGEKLFQTALEIWPHPLSEKEK